MGHATGKMKIFSPDFGPFCLAKSVGNFAIWEAVGCLAPDQSAHIRSCFASWGFLCTTHHTNNDSSSNAFGFADPTPQDPRR